MKLLKIVAFGAIAATLTACSTADVVSRNTPLETPRLAAEAAPQVLRDYSLHAVRFAIPADMTVSEANSYYPIADIVWRGDPLGDRSEQISEMFQSSIRAAGLGLTGATPVIADVELVRFHSLTERTRYSVGGVHSIKFDLTIRDAETGEVLEPTRRINGDLPGLGGYAALAADNSGETQKVRIIRHLSSLFYQNMTGMTGQGQTTLAGS
ncbi:hypothetical protein Q4555_12610 [Octadecabacter sp. 1_MG-2023]|uniref:DUF6778 family protein n=1 Tax=unclassified Octadecabacter TaxID=196158 RepID=UPI001C0919CD|nr:MULTISPECIES: DUF6778 family protein [unclassified Octadecabacter]MBU2993642.1 hypothetical protein [Octadecabacter sp. B2R22]MDO6735514.1 hypothetical protein [Octadecabacter sp. 1_MG-2023]